MSMRVSTGARVRTLVVALIAVGLIGTSAPGTALADSEGRLQGRIVVPPGTPINTFSIVLWTRSLGYENDWLPHLQSLYVQTSTPDFDFSTTSKYHEWALELVAFAPGLVGGFYAGPGEPLAADMEGAMPLLGGAKGIELVPVKGVEMSGVLTLPDGVDLADREIAIDAVQVSARGQRLTRTLKTTVGPDSAGRFVLAQAREGGHYTIQVSDPVRWDQQPRFAEGWVNLASGGLVDSPEWATPVRQQCCVHLVVSEAHVAPVLSALDDHGIEGSAVMGETLSARVAPWSISGVAVTYEWLRGGVLIPGATYATYQLAPLDIGHRIGLRITGSKSPLPDVVQTTALTAPVDLGAAPQATIDPDVTGRARLGSTLVAWDGVWDVFNTHLSHQWLRNGKVIEDAEGPYYILTAADVGKKVAVLVTANAYGRHSGASSSTARRVAKGKPKVTVKAKKKARAGRQVRVVVRVKVAGLAQPTGKVVAKYGKKAVKAKLRAKDKGKVVLRLPKLARGRYKVAVTYKPNAKSKRFVTKATSKSSTLRVR